MCSGGVAREYFPTTKMISVDNNEMKEAPVNETPFCKEKTFISIIRLFPLNLFVLSVSGSVSVLVNRVWGSSVKRTPENRLYIHFILITSPRFNTSNSSRTFH